MYQNGQDRGSGPPSGKFLNKVDAISSYLATKIYPEMTQRANGKAPNDLVRKDNQRRSMSCKGSNVTHLSCNDQLTMAGKLIVVG